MKICTKCKVEKSLDCFVKDSSKKYGIYPSCGDCRRKRTGAVKFSEKFEPRKEVECGYCKKVFRPRNVQYNENQSGILFCSRKHYNLYRASTATSYYYGYKPYILERDGNKCMISGKTDDLVVHHIKTRGSGGKDEYNNLVTLNAYIHTYIVHGLEGRKYTQQLKSYAESFERPGFRDEVMEVSKRNYKRVQKENNKRSRTYNHRNKDLVNERNREKRKRRNEKCKEIHKMTYDKYTNDFKKKYGITPTQYKYQQSLKAKKSLSRGS